MNRYIPKKKFSSNTFISQTEADKRIANMFYLKAIKFGIGLERVPERIETWGLSSPHQILADTFNPIPISGRTDYTHQYFWHFRCPCHTYFFNSFLGQSRKLVPFFRFFPTSNEILQDKSNEKKKIRNSLFFVKMTNDLVLIAQKT